MNRTNLIGFGLLGGLAVAALVVVPSCRSNPFDPVPFKVTNRLPNLIKTLKPGMTYDEVVHRLGLWEYQNHRREGGGPVHAHWTTWELRPDCNLELVFDSTGKTDLFVTASLNGGDFYPPIPPPQ